MFSARGIPGVSEPQQRCEKGVGLVRVEGRLTWAFENWVCWKKKNTSIGWITRFGPVNIGTITTLNSGLSYYKDIIKIIKVPFVWRCPQFQTDSCIPVRMVCNLSSALWLFQRSRSPWVPIWGLGWNYRATRMVGILPGKRSLKHFEKGPIQIPILLTSNQFNGQWYHLLIDHTEFHTTQVLPKKLKCQPSKTTRGLGERDDCFLESKSREALKLFGVVWIG